MDSIRWAIIIASVVAIAAWWRAGYRNPRFRISRWAVMMIPAARIVFYVIKALGKCSPETLNYISSWMILWTILVLAGWGIAVAYE